MTKNIDKAYRLFQFLADLQSAKDQPIRKIGDFTKNGGAAFKISSLLKSVNSSKPQIEFGHELAVSLNLDELMRVSDGSSGIVIRAYRPSVPELAPLPPELSRWIDGDIENFQATLTIASSIKDTEGSTIEASDLSTDERQSIETWLNEWETQALRAREMSIYQKLFDMQVKSNQQADEFELVLGVGRLAWDTNDPKEAIDRHIFTVKLESSMDKQTGRLEFVLAEGGLAPELEAIPVNHISDGRFIKDVEDKVAEFDDYPLDREAFDELGTFTAHGLTTDAKYISDLDTASAASYPVLSWTPTILLRPRQRLGLAQSFKRIAEMIQKSGTIPAGLATLIDPSQQPELVPNQQSGAVVEVTGEIFSPLPLNEQQRKVIERVDNHGQTIVQGPPGTGKTHMAAALLSHLLAQGKKVLVTAETERALYELRDKLPSQIQELAVTVLGSTTEDLADLEVAIQTIQSKSADFDELASTKKISSLESSILRLEERRVSSLRQWSNRLQAEQTLLGVSGFDLPLPQAIEKVEQQRADLSWISQLSIPQLDQAFPLTHEELECLFKHLDDPAIDDEARAQASDFLDPSSLPSSIEFDRVVGELRHAELQLSDKLTQIQNSNFLVWKDLSADRRDQVRDFSNSALKHSNSLGLFNQPWASHLRPDTDAPTLSAAEKELTEVQKLVNDATEYAETLTSTRRISVEGQVDHFVPTARTLLEYLARGKQIQTKTDGSVKIPFIGGSVIKDSLPFFESVRVDSMPPTTVEAIEQYLSYVEASWLIEELQKRWPAVHGTTGQLTATIEAFRYDLNAYRGYLQHHRELSRLLWEIRSIGFLIDVSQVDSFSRSLTYFGEVLQAEEKAREADNKLVPFRNLIVNSGYTGKLHSWISELQDAINALDVSGYQNALDTAEASLESIGKARELVNLSSKLYSWSQDAYEKITGSIDADIWRKRAFRMEEARCWLQATKTISDRNREDGNAAQVELDAIDRELHETVTSLATAKAWHNAVGKSRIDETMRADMIHYTQSVKRLGKGTGRFAEQQRRAVRESLERTRSAVPVWIMPIYKVVEQFELKENMFDVVIVDEASQAGVEAIFLQYLASRIVVIGDDRQVSPSAVGVDQERIKSVARQYLYDFDYVDAWTDPKRSLFDDADMRYGGRIVLNEHRRCVPEIIEFSNALSYRPNNIELKPVRTVASNRIAPFRITQTPNAFESQSGKINKAEADTLVKRLMDALEDPTYDGKTIGVISLLSSSGQAKYIQRQLLEKLPPQVWEERDLKVGNPAEFQGAERDVVFLTMVTPASPTRRVQALTAATYLQRYNVAVSRAKDQIWLFHSIGMEDLTNPEDVRSKLLNHAYAVARSAPESREISPVPDDEHVAPFDSLFEQRVYNQLVERGYYVESQHDAFGYRIDLVVHGSAGKLAVECDGDYWHGPDHAQADLQRQRELERLGWKFVRILESDYYLDKNGQIDRVVDALKNLGIKPGSYLVDVDTSGKNIEIIQSVYSETASAVDFSPEVDSLPDSETDSSNRRPEDAVVTEPRSQEKILRQSSGRMAPPSPDQKRTLATEPVEVYRPASEQDLLLEYLEEYNEFNGALPSVYGASPDELKDGLLEILSLEGPIKGRLLFSRYVTSGGDRKVAKTARTILNRTLHHLLGTGAVVCSDPEKATGYTDKVFRLPDQSEVSLRTRGSRDLRDIPADELRQLINVAHKHTGYTNSDTLMRATLKVLNIHRLTQKATEILLPHCENVLSLEQRQ